MTIQSSKRSEAVGFEWSGLVTATAKLNQIKVWDRVTEQSWLRVTKAGLVSQTKIEVASG